MRNRERGAAHVNIFFFLIMLVMFLAAVFVGYSQFSENNSLKEDIKKAKIDAASAKLAVDVRDEQLKALGTVIGEVGKYTPKKDFTDLLKDAGLTELPTSTDGPDPEKVGATMKAFGAALGVPESMKTLGDLMNGAKASYDGATKKASDTDLERNKALADRASLEKTLTDEQGARQKDVSTLTGQHNEFRSTVDAGLKGKDDLINSMRTQVSERDKNLEAEKQAHAADNLKNSKEIGQLRAVISAQTERMKLLNPPQAPDGEIVSSSPTVARAYINLGRKDMLPVGTLFRVTGRGKTDVKAYAEVTKLEQDRAEVKISGLKDPFDPVVKGDQIANDLFAPNVKRTICLIGRYTYPLTKPTVKLLLENLGNKVVEKIGPGVDLVVVGGDSLNEGGDGFTPVDQTQDYKDALFHGVEIAPLHKIRDFLKLSD